MKVLSLFSGIGAFEIALNEENVEWSLDHFCEIDKYAVQSYNMIHGTTDDDNLKDVTDIDYSTIGDIDLVTYGFPCQDISLAGQQKGFVDENGNITRSGLFFNAADVIRHTNPKFAIFENVKNLTSKKFKSEFDTVLSTLDELGYNTYWQVLNAKNYGVPQNRERVFGVSIRKDIDRGFKFPERFPLKLRLKDMLEDTVDEKYYLSDKMLGKITYAKKESYSGIIEEANPHKGGQKAGVISTEGICSTLTVTDYKPPKQILEEPKVINPLKDKTDNGWHFEQQVYDANGITRTIKAGGGSGNIPKVIEELNSKRLGGIFDDEKGKHQAGSVWDTDHLAPTLDTMQGGYRQPCVIVPENTKRGYKEAYEGDSVNLEQPNSKTRRGRVGEQVSQTLTTSCNQGVVVKDPSELLKGTNYDRKFGSKGKLQDRDGVCATLQAAMGCGGGNIPITYESLRIRKLTPRECWRLMGFRDRYFDRVKGVSNTQLYKQAGNSIVVDVLRAIVRSFKEQYPEYFVEEDDDLL